MSVKPRLRWNGLMWARAEKLHDCWLYWRSWYETGVRWTLEGRFYADRCSELLPR